MKAVVFREHGDVERLEIAELPEPKIKENEVLVEVRACALNHLDLWVRRGLPGIAIPLPHIPGSDTQFPPGLGAFLFRVVYVQPGRQP